MNRSDSVLLSNVISGSGALVQSGSGTTILTGSNSYTGQSIVSAGTLLALSGQSLGTGTLILSGSSTNQATFSSFTGSSLTINSLVLNGYSTIALAGGNSLTATNAVIINGLGNILSLSGAWTNGTTTLLSGRTLATNGTISLSIKDLGIGVLPLGSTINMGQFSYSFTNAGSSLNLSINQNVVTYFWAGGSAGTWDTTSTNWSTNANAEGGASKVFFSNNNAVFGSSASITVTNAGILADTISVTNSTGTVSFSGGAISGYSFTNAGSGALLVSSSLTLGGGAYLGSGTFSDTGSGSVTLAGNFIYGALAMSGMGTLTLSASNSYAGGTTFSNGTIAIGNKNALGSGTLSMLGNGTIQPTLTGLSIGNDSLIGTGVTETINVQTIWFTNAGAIRGGGALAMSGMGTLTLSASNSYAGGTTFSNGTIAIGNKNALGSGTLSMLGNGTLQAATNGLVMTNISVIGTGVTETINVLTNRFTNAGAIRGGGAIAMNGTGTLTLSASNSYAGGTTFSNGTIAIGNKNALGSGDLNMAGSGTLQAATNNLLLINTIQIGAGSNGVIDVQTNGLSLSGSVSGTGALKMAGGGTLVLTGSNGYSGGTVISSGTLQVGSGGGSGNLGGGTVSNNGLLLFNRSDAVYFANVISGTGALVQAGAGTLALSTNNTYAGQTTVQSGTLALTGSGSVYNNGLSAGSIVVNAGGNLFLGRNDTFGINAVNNSPVVITVNQGGVVQNGAFFNNLNNLTLNGGELRANGGATSGASGGLNAFQLQNTVTVGGSYKPSIITANSSVNSNNGISLYGNTTFNVADVFSEGMYDVANPDLVVSAALVNDTISSYSSLTKAGDGFMLMTGSNQYSGPTIVQAGTLEFGNTNAFYGGNTNLWTSTKLNVTNGATVIFAVGGTGGFTSDQLAQILKPNPSNYNSLSPSKMGFQSGSAIGIDVSGTNFALNASVNNFQLYYSKLGLTVVGNGTLVLTKNNNYNGNTLIENSLLQIGDGGTTGTIGSSNGSVDNEGQLVFNRSNIIAVANSIDGAGPLSQNGTGTLILSGNNGYWGGTFLNAGTVNLGSANAIGSGGIRFSGGTLQFSAANKTDYSSRFSTDSNQAYSLDTAGQNVTLANPLSSSNGSLAKLGDGTLILTGNNSYSGPTTIAAGSLQLGNGGTNGSLGSGSVTDNGMLVFNRSDAATIGNVISGSGSLAQIGAGSLILMGANGYTGETILEGGTTVVSGSVTSGSDLIVGKSNSGVSLLITNGGIVNNGSTVYGGVIGLGVKSSNNTVTVSDSGSLWSNGAYLSIGYGGSGNGLLIANGGSVLSGSGSIGSNSFSSNNAVTVTGYSSLWSNHDDLFVGGQGSGNRLMISNGGTVVNGGSGYGGVIGLGSGSSNNAVIVSDSGSQWSNGASLAVGYSGSSNSLIISGGARVTDLIANIGNNSQSSNNAVLVTGARSLWSGGALNIGLSGSGNSLVIDNGGTVASVSNIVVGANAAALGNSILITGTNANGSTSLLAAGGDLTVGNSGSSSAIIVFNGAVVIDRNGFLGMYSSNNSVVITGVNSLWSNNSSLTVGYAGSGTLTVANGGTVRANAMALASQPLSVGTLNIGSLGGGDTAGTITTSTIAFGLGSGTINFNQTDTATIASSISGIGSVNQLGAGTTVLSGSNSYGGVTTIAGGTLQVGDGGTNGTLGSGAVTDNGSLIFNRSDSVAVGNSISGTGSVNQLGAGTTVLSGSNSYTGPTLVEGGALQITGSLSNNERVYIGNAGAAASMVITNGGFVADIVGVIGNQSSASNNSVTVAGVGSLWNNAGDLYVGYSGSGNSLLITNGAVVRSGFSQFGSAISLYYGYSNSAVVTGAGSLWSNISSLTIGWNGGGELTVANGGTVRANAMTLASQPLSVGTLNIGSLGGGDTAGTITTSTIAFGLGSGTINFNQSDTATIASSISGTGSVNQLGAGTTILTGANTYTGSTIATNGTLLANNSAGSAIGTSSVLVTNTGTLGGNGTIQGATTIASGGTLASGSGGVGSLSFKNALRLTTGSTTSFQIHSTNDFTSINLIGGSVTYGGTLVFNLINYVPVAGNAFTLFNMTGGATQSGDFFSVTAGSLSFTESGGIWSASYGAYAYQFSQSTGQLSVQAAPLGVPEPSTYALFGIGAIGLLMVLRRKKTA
ncbi:MAG: autotransporter-associated beta strand repeat-containing protein [Verrucomicrobiota bacterium]